MAPIVLQMEVNSMGCANKIEKAIKKMPGVTAVRPRVGEGRVVVEGTAVDAEALRARLESKLKKPVVVISTGVEPPPMQAPRPARRAAANASAAAGFTAAVRRAAATGVLPVPVRAQPVHFSFI
uniref:HMA domain-containing protein n=1 Tax=Oryza brachyantha TaxID=4533 RepID=J3MKL3_ORYBR